MKTVIDTPNAPRSVGPYSQAVCANGFVFVSGQVAINPADNTCLDGNVAEQTELAINNLKAILEAAGSTLKKVVKCNVYLKDINDFDEMNSVYAHYFSANQPARLTVATAGMFAGFSVEIDAIALV